MHEITHIAILRDVLRFAQVSHRDKHTHTHKRKVCAVLHHKNCIAFIILKYFAVTKFNLFQ